VLLGQSYHTPHDAVTGEYEALVEWYWQGKPKELGETPIPVPLCTPQMPHGLTRVQTRASALDRMYKNILQMWFRLFFATTPWQALGSLPAIRRLVVPGGKAKKGTECETDHSSQSAAKIKNTRSFTDTAWVLVVSVALRHTQNFVFIARIQAFASCGEESECR
jgi:hypothetical protein